MSAELVVGDFRFHLQHKAVLVGVSDGTEEDLTALFDGGADCVSVPDGMAESLGRRFDIPILRASDIRSEAIEGYEVGAFQEEWDLVRLVFEQALQLSKGVRILKTDSRSVKSSRRIIDLDAAVSSAG